MGKIKSIKNDILEIIKKYQEIQNKSLTYQNLAWLKYTKIKKQLFKEADFILTMKTLPSGQGQSSVAEPTEQ